MVQKKTVELAVTDGFKPTIQMYLRTILLVFTYIVMGICSEITGPTMGMLAHNTHVTFNGIATALASASAGGLLTNILCGIFQRFTDNYQDLMLATGYFLRAILASATPFINSLILLCITFFFQGIVGSVANMAGTNLLLKMWKTHAAAPLNMIHFGYGFGAICANLIVRPFMNDRNSYQNTTLSSQVNSTLSASRSMLMEWDIRVPYLISAALCLVISIGHLIFLIQEQIKKRNKAEKQKVEYGPVSTNETHQDEVKYSQYSPATCGHGHLGYGLSLSVLFVVYMFFLVGTDQAFAKFYFSYLKFDKFGISTNGASWGIILFWLAFSAARLIGAIESLFIPPSICLAISWFGGLILAATWLIYVWILSFTSTSLLVLGSLTGLIIGPLYAQSFAWINEKLNVTSLLLAAIFCGAGLGSLIIQKIAGFVMDYHPNHFPTLITVCVIISIILYILSSVIVFLHQKSLKNKPDAIENDEPLTKDKFNETKQKMVNYAESGMETQ